MEHIKLNPDAIERALVACGHALGAGVVALLPEAEKAGLPLLQEACSQHGLALLGGHISRPGQRG